MMPNWRRSFIGVILVSALLAVVAHLGELKNFVALLRRAEPGWLLIAILLQLSTYASLAFAWRAVLLRAEGKRYKVVGLIRIALSKLFADQALPTAGMSGNLLLVDQLVGIGALRGTAVAALLLSLIGFYAAYLLFALGALLLLWSHGHATPMMVGLVTSFVLVATAIPALALWLRHRGSQPLPPLIERIRPIGQLLKAIAEAPAALVKDRTLLARMVLFNALVFSADIMTLYACLHGLGASVSLATGLIAFVLASIVVTLGPIPFGLGSFEVVCTSTLGLLGVPVEAALAGTLLLRFLILWLPLVPGFLLSRRLLGRRPPAP